MVSVAGIVIVAAVGGVSASYALTRQSPDHPSAAPTSGSSSRHPVAPTAPLSTLSPPPTSPAPSVSHRPTPPARPATRHQASRRTAHTRQSPAILLRTLDGPCWVGVTSADGRQLVAKTLRPHHRLAITAEHVHVTLGNAGAVVVRIDGHRPHRAGRPGQVTSFRT